MSTPSIPGVDRDTLAYAVHNAFTSTHLSADCHDAADAALAHIAAHHECACDREHDEWVEVDEATFHASPDGTRLRAEWAPDRRFFIHRDDLPDDPRALIARELGPAGAAVILGLLDEHGWTVTRKGDR